MLPKSLALSRRHGLRAPGRARAAGPGGMALRALAPLALIIRGQPVLALRTSAVVLPPRSPWGPKRGQLEISFPAAVPLIWRGENLQEFDSSERKTEGER